MGLPVYRYVTKTPRHRFNVMSTLCSWYVWKGTVGWFSHHIYLNYDCKLDESLSYNSICYIEMTYDLKQLIVQRIRETIETSYALNSILVSRLTLISKKKNGVMKYNLVIIFSLITNLSSIIITSKRLIIILWSSGIWQISTLNHLLMIWIIVICSMVLPVKRTFPGISGRLNSPKYATRMLLSI